MIYVKAVAVCDTAPETKVMCKSRKNYDVPVHDDHDGPSLPKGWGRYLTRVLCPKCAKRVRKVYGDSAVTL